MANAVKVMQLRHLGRELSTALELALVGRAPAPLVEQLASATGLVVALAELPLDTEALRAWSLDAVSRAERALERWHTWGQQKNAVA